MKRKRKKGGWGVTATQPARNKHNYYSRWKKPKREDRS